MAGRTVGRALLPVLVAIGIFGAMAHPAEAQVGGGSIEISTLFPNIVVDRIDRVTFPLNVANNGDSARNFALEVVDAPGGWDAVLKARGFTVRQMYLAGGKSESVDLQVKPPDRAEARDYRFLVRASDDAGTQLAALSLTLGLRPAQTAGGVQLVTAYPVLRGPNKSKFQFKLDLKNGADEERTYSFSAVSPQNWQVLIKPSFEDKQISSISMKGGESKTIDVEVQPPERVQAGDYPIVVQAAGGGQQATANLQVTLTGTYELTLKTPSGRLNAQATAGQPSPFSILVSNTGSADLSKVSLTSSKPEGWDVKFDPDAVDGIEAGGTREIRVTVTPAARAIAGDYMLTVTASNPQTSKNADIRVTVDTPTLWGWLGVGVIVLLLGGLFLVFRIVGRR